MRIGLIAEKVGMTRIFSETAQHIPVTILKIEDCKVIGFKTLEKHGYQAVQIGAKNKKLKHVSKAMQGHFSQAKVEAKAFLKELRVDSFESLEIGKELKVDIFSNTQYVDVTGVSIGKGFAGSMKRHNFGGLRASHGVSVSHRSHGSTGQRQDPGKVFKGKKMAGHMGARQVTIQNLEIINADKEKNLLFLKGAVPGANGSIIFVRNAIKKLEK